MPKYRSSDLIEKVRDRCGDGVGVGSCEEEEELLDE
jgi:hypothetical protein